MAEPNSPIHRRPGLYPSLYRLVLAALAATVLWLSIGNYAGWRHRFEELSELAEIHGVADRRPGLVAGMRRDAGPTRAALRLARALLADELNQRWILDLPADAQDGERARGLERLDVAYQLGVESLAERPGSWEAFLVIGGAEYLRLARRRDQRLLSERELWLAPLEEAHRLAPLQPEPLRFLAAADLGNWSVLSEQEKEHATRRLESALADSTTFDLLSSAWLRVAPSLAQALAIVPDKTWAWSGLMQYFARRGDWERFCAAQRKSIEVTRSFAGERLDEAESRLRWGDRDKGIQRLLWVGANTRPDGSNVALIERVLAMFPPGVGGEASDRWLKQWLDWSLDRCARAGGCRLSETGLRRLISLNRRLPPEKKAWALAAAGSLREAEAIARTYTKTQTAPLSADWAPYVTHQASLLAARGEPSVALDLLRQVPLMGRDSVPYWLTYEAVAELAGEDLEAAKADAWLAIRARTAWDRNDWVVTRQTARLDLWPADTAAGVSLKLSLAAAADGVVELVWDGSVTAILPAAHGRAVDLVIPVTREAHTLEIRSREGAPTATAAVRLLPPAP